MGRNVIDRTGQRYGRLTVLRPAERVGTSTNLRWMCRCDCGCIKSVSGAALHDGSTRSCGCLGRERRAAALNRRWHGRRARTFIRGDSPSRRRAIAADFVDWIESATEPVLLTFSRGGAWRGSRRLAHALGQGSTFVGAYLPGVTVTQLLEDMAEAAKGQA